MGLDGSAIVLLVQTAVGPPGVYFEIGGQTGLKIDRKAKTLDFTDKTIEDTQVQPSVRSSTITLDHFYVPNDAGLNALKNAYRTGNMIVAERQENGVVTEYANCVITGLSEDDKMHAPATVQTTLEVSGGWQPGAAP